MEGRRKSLWPSNPEEENNAISNTEDVRPRQLVSSPGAHLDHLCLICWGIHPALVACTEPGTVLGSRATAVDKIEKNLCSHDGDHIL